MKRSKKIPARKTMKAAPKKGATTTEAAAKDAATPTTTKAPRERDPRLPAPGAVIDREYKGKTVKLKFLDDGVEIDGKTFTSLSAAARHVTGAASINGFLWAGLIVREAKPASKDAKPAAATPGDENDLSTPEGQRSALRAAGLVKTPRGTPDQVASAA